MFHHLNQSYQNFHIKSTLILVEIIARHLHNNYYTKGKGVLILYENLLKLVYCKLGFFKMQIKKYKQYTDRLGIIGIYLINIDTHSKQYINKYMI